jgi:hypothetical protein
MISRRSLARLEHTRILSIPVGKVISRRCGCSGHGRQAEQLEFRTCFSSFPLAFFSFNRIYWQLFSDARLRVGRGIPGLSSPRHAIVGLRIKRCRCARAYRRCDWGWLLRVMWRRVSRGMVLRFAPSGCEFRMDLLRITLMHS